MRWPTLTIRTRLIVCCVLLVLCTGLSLMWFAHRDTIATLRSSERRSLNNIMFVLESELAAAHTEGLQSRTAVLDETKQRLQAAALAAYPQINKLFADPLNPDFQLEFYVLPESLPTTLLNATLLPSDTKPLPPGPLEASKLINLHGASAVSQLPGPVTRVIPLLFTAGEGRFTADFGATLVEPVQQSNSGDSNQMVGELQQTGALQQPEEQGSSLYWVQRFPLGIMVCQANLTLVEANAAQKKQAAATRFATLLEQVKIQQTGFAAALDSSGQRVAGPQNIYIPEKLSQQITSGLYAGAARRLMVLDEVLYLLSYFRPLDWTLVVAAPLDELETSILGLVSRQMLITLGIIAVGMLIGLALGNQISRPIRKLTAIVRDLPQRDLTGLDGADSADLLADLPDKRKDEVGDLARSFGFMASELSGKVRELLRVQAERQRLNNELAVAHDIQYGILPEPLEDLFSPTGKPRFELHSSMLTAKQVGGDLYDFFLLNDRELYFVMGDVSDKSVPAALFMSMAVTTIRSALQGPELRQAQAEQQTEITLQPNEVTAAVNNMLARHNPRNMFVTLCIGVLNLQSGQLAWASAGHMPPICIGQNGSRELQRSEEMVAGVFDGIPYTTFTANLAPGETVYLYTDGVSEALNSKLELFGTERLLSCLDTQYAKTPQEVVEATFEAVKEFVAGAEQSDDIAMLTIRWLGADSK